MYSKNYLVGKIKMAGMTQQELASQMGISVSGLSLKINGRREFSVSEINKIIDALQLTDEDVVSIFFSPEIA